MRFHRCRTVEPPKDKPFIALYTDGTTGPAEFIEATIPRGHTGFKAMDRRSVEHKGSIIAWAPFNTYPTEAITE